LGEYTANALEVCRALLGKGAAVDPYMQPDGTHCEACWAKQVPACMDFLFGGKYE
jgi:putative hydrolase